MHDHMNVKLFNFYFNIKASPKCCRNLYVWNGGVKAQQQVPVCNLEVRIFHYKKKNQHLSNSFYESPVFYFTKIYPVVPQLNARAETLADIAISCKFTLRTQ